MIPAHFEWVDGLPLTPSGKRDDQTLRDMPLSTIAVLADAVPCTSDELAVADIMAEFGGWCSIRG